MPGAGRVAGGDPRGDAGGLPAAEERSARVEEGRDLLLRREELEVAEERLRRNLLRAVEPEEGRAKVDAHAVRRLVADVPERDEQQAAVEHDVEDHVRAAARRARAPRWRTPRTRAPRCGVARHGVSRPGRRWTGPRGRSRGFRWRSRWPTRSA